MQLPSADNFSSTRLTLKIIFIYTLTLLGREFRILFISVSEQVLGTSNPFLLPNIIVHKFNTLGQSSNNPGSAYSAMNNWYEGSKFRLKNTVKVFTSSYTNKTIAVCKFREDTNIVRVFKLTTISHKRF